MLDETEDDTGLFDTGNRRFYPYCMMFPSNVCAMCCCPPAPACG